MYKKYKLIVGIVIYLGSKLLHGDKNEINIKCRIAHAKQAFYKKKHLFTTNSQS